MHFGGLPQTGDWCLCHVVVKHRLNGIKLDFHCPVEGNQESNTLDSALQGSGTLSSLFVCYDER